MITKRSLTKRVLDARDSAAPTASISLASSFFCFQAESTPISPNLNQGFAARWGLGEPSTNGRKDVQLTGQDCVNEYAILREKLPNSNSRNLLI
jgi:hypothetical protein